MLSILCRRFQSQQGAAVVEFVLVVPILLLFLFGIIEFSLIMYNKHILTNASREGARYGIVVTGGARHSLSDIQKVVRDWAQNRMVSFGTDKLEDSDILAEMCLKDTDCTDETNWTALNPVARVFGDKLRVSTSYQYDFLLLPNIPIFGAENDLPGILTLDAETVMNYE